MPIIPLIIAVGFALMALERRFPAFELPRVRGWWIRVVLVNLAQLAVVLAGGATWDRWLQRGSVLHLRTLMPGESRMLAALVAYVAITFVFYWWHRFRHEARPAWLALHQLHHSASRIETITSFFKHPLEILCNSLIIGVLIYAILGLDSETAAVVTLLTALAEFFYHMNLRTPHWVGYILQRPEMHRIHHQRDHHTQNFADLPIWDILFGTFHNPRTIEHPCGFAPAAEARFADMLRFRTADAPTPRPLDARRIAALLLVGIGLLQPLGFLADSLPLRGLGYASAASPLPLVFTQFRGMEPFVADFALALDLTDGARLTVPITPATYARLAGPYNRRNVYGAMIAAGPKLTSPSERALWTSVLGHGLCRGGPLARELGLAVPVRAATVIVHSQTRGHTQDVWRLPLECRA
jgi:sterol desaturase/sphingolipid hydroxylase (fatty acid hydroxylase superfamily)